MIGNARDSPIRLANGQLLCGAHGFVTCAKCCVDYTFVQELDGEYSSHMLKQRDTIPGNDDQSCELSDVSGLCSSGVDTSDESTIIDSSSEEAAASPSVAPTGILIAVDDDPKPRFPALPKRFFPPEPVVSPRVLFRPRLVFHKDHPGIQRFIGIHDTSQYLVYAGGACLENGKGKLKAGWSFVFKPPAPDRPTSGRVSSRLEATGPTGKARRPSSHRAELRAVIAALSYLHEDGDLFKSIVVATDSTYVVHSATRLLQTWMSNGWINLTGRPVQNKDLWQTLLQIVDGWAKKGREVYLWRIPRKWNRDADECARAAVTSIPVPVDFEDLSNGNW
ncbi:ribonuclease H-like protein [Aspergillus ibericus CBS 121593]|uniref:ribonuclease H n=1 Tax=Aspergillus ibericus CBS 121593 TaxID=1448316 RepID=A0A395HDL2_9EURO|nr:ribonuclease H-like protein [Aspergillus ibericus CBS 121593]RAL05932.1 ribonuclease H-like protein [Aspergillus ibericus CBS 121593]